MRLLIAVLVLPLIAACSLTLAPLSHDGQNCGSDSSHHGSQCLPVVIVIVPSYQYADNSDTMCFQFSPIQASVAVGGTYSFQNTTSSPITIQGADRSTWVTVAPGATSAALSVTATGSYNFGVQGCRGVGGTPWYGVLAVTSN